jgi:hypothetical protein
VSIVCSLFTLIYILFLLFAYILCENSIRAQMCDVAEFFLIVKPDGYLIPPRNSVGMGTDTGMNFYPQV